MGLLVAAALAGACDDAGASSGGLFPSPEIGTGGGIALGTGGHPSSGGLPGIGGSTGGSPVVTDGGSPGYPWGGNGGEGPTADEQQAQAWLAEQGTQCAASDAQASSTATLPTPECLLLEIKLPGVFEYSAVSIGAFPDPFAPRAWKSLGCDSAGSACNGRLEYEWSVEYENENQWLLVFTPVMPECDYAHVILAADSSGDANKPRAVIRWKPFTVRLNLQPTADGYKVGSIRNLDGSLVDPLALTADESFIGWMEEGARTALGNALLDHIKAQGWSCTR